MSKENICPWCGDEIQDLWEFGLEDGEAREFDCPSCDKKIDISLSISYDYKIRAAGCAWHILGLHLDMSSYTGNRFVVFECTVCKNEFYDHDLPPPIGKFNNLKEGTYEYTKEAEAALSRVIRARREAEKLLEGKD